MKERVIGREELRAAMDATDDNAAACATFAKQQTPEPPP
jgi:hypothetical protein